MAVSNEEGWDLTIPAKDLPVQECFYCENTVIFGSVMSISYKCLCIHCISKDQRKNFKNDTSNPCSKCGRYNTKTIFETVDCCLICYLKRITIFLDYGLSSINISSEKSTFTNALEMPIAEGFKYLGFMNKVENGGIFTSGSVTLYEITDIIIGGVRLNTDKHYTESLIFYLSNTPPEIIRKGIENSNSAQLTIKIGRRKI